jgi:hypothetical protein
MATRTRAKSERPDVDPEVVKRLAELVDGDAWSIADYLVEQFPIDEYGDAEHGTNTGLRLALDRYQGALYEQYGVELRSSTMRGYRATALRWPEAERSASASFGAHDRLRGPDRFDRMRRYLRANGGHALSARTVRRMRADESPGKPPLVFEERMRLAIERAVRRVLLEGIVTDRDDWWNVRGVSADMRTTAVQKLRALAGQIEAT